jgi:hypothetical protein
MQNWPKPQQKQAFLIAHGAIGDELSPEMKISANKYLRIVEVGRAGRLTGTLYKSFAFA